MTIAREKIHAICVCFQSSGVDLFTPSSCVSGNFENAEGVNLADAQMNGQGRWRNQPAAVPGMRDGFLAVKKR